MPIYKTLDDVIDAEVRCDINNFVFLKLSDDGTLIIPDTSLLVMYYPLIQNSIASVTVTMAQRKEFRCKPQILSTRIYGTPFMDWVLLQLNDRDCASHFHIGRYLRLIPPNDLNSVLELLSSKSAERREDNNTKVMRVLLNQ